jgi:hypothetical protein
MRLHRTIWICVCAVVGVAFLVAGLSACGGSSSGGSSVANDGMSTASVTSEPTEGTDSTESVDSAASELDNAKTFQGGGTSRAGIRWVTLRAGDALKGYVVPASRAEANYGVAISLGSDALSALQSGASAMLTDPYDAYYSEASYNADSFFSDAAPPASDFGSILYSSEWYDPADIFQQHFSTGPPSYFVSGRPTSYGGGGTWFMFMAPVDGTYGVIVAGDDATPYKVTLQRHAAPEIQTPDPSTQFDQSGASSSFPFEGSSWAEAARGQTDWLFEDGFFPAQTFYSDWYTDAGSLDPGQSYEPTAQLKAGIQNYVGQYTGAGAATDSFSS